jgi:hypothetical protein
MLFPRDKKWATMSGVTPWLKSAIWLLVIYGILSMLLSPPPQLSAAFAGKSLLLFFVLVTYALLHLLFSALFLGFQPARPGLVTSAGFLEKICLRLC